MSEQTAWEIRMLKLAKGLMESGVGLGTSLSKDELWDAGNNIEQMVKNYTHKANLDRLHRIIAHIAEHGIQTSEVTARIWMSEANMKRDSVTVLEEGMAKGFVDKCGCGNRNCDVNQGRERDM